VICGYATGVFSSRKFERASYDSITLRYLSANTHPDHDTITSLRRRFQPQLEALLVQVLMIAHEMKLFKMSNISLDGTKIKANARKHKALCYQHLKKIEEHEVKALTAQAEAADTVPVNDGMDIPAEIARREERLAVMAIAKKKLKPTPKSALSVNRSNTKKKQSA
jgi:hypothetical protein